MKTNQDLWAVSFSCISIKALKLNHSTEKMEGFNAFLDFLKKSKVPQQTPKLMGKPSTGYGYQWDGK